MLDSPYMLPSSVIIVVAVLTVFFCTLLVLKYAVADNFLRTRLIMTAFFLFIIATLTISFWQYTWDTLPYTAPAAVLGIAAGYFIGVREAEQKLAKQGLTYYTEHFSHVHIHDLAGFNWWAVVNFYSVMGGVVLINLIGLSNVIFGGSERWAILTSTVGAFLLGTIAPYLVHLWTIKATHHPTSTTSEA